MASGVIGLRERLKELGTPEYVMLKVDRAGSWLEVTGTNGELSVEGESAEALLTAARDVSRQIAKQKR